MRNSISRGFSVVTARFGRCTKCMRQSFSLAALVWVIAGALSNHHPLRYLAMGVASALTALWAAHLLKFSVTTAARKAVNVGGSTGASDLSCSDPARRRTAGLLFRATGVAMLASVPILIWPSRSYAFCGQCSKDDDCGGRSNGWCCKNTAPVNSGSICNECVKC